MFFTFLQVAKVRQVSRAFDANCQAVLNEGFKKALTDLVALKKTLDAAPKGSQDRKFIPVLCGLAHGLVSI